MTTTYDPQELRYYVWDVDKRTVRLRGREFPRFFQARLEHPGWPVRMQLAVTVDPERGPIATGLSNMRPRKNHDDATDLPTYRELDALLSATIALPALLRSVTADAAGVWYAHQLQDDFIEQAGGSLDGIEGGELLSFHRQSYEEGRKLADTAYEATRPRRRRTLSTQYLGEVATAYRSALDEGLPPTQHVADHFHVSHSTAARWVRMARKAGQLGEALGPKAGEAGQQ